MDEFFFVWDGGCAAQHISLDGLNRCKLMVDPLSSSFELANLYFAFQSMIGAMADLVLVHTSPAYMHRLIVGHAIFIPTPSSPTPSLNTAGE